MNPSETPPPADPSSSSSAFSSTAATADSSLRAEVADTGNFPAALGAGLVAAIVGAAIWAAVTVATGYQIGFMAIGVGFLVGYAVRIAGRGTDQRFAIAGAVLALAGCVLGNLLTVVGVVAGQENVGFFSLLTKLTPSVAVEFLQISFQPMDLLFYAIAVYEGFKVSRPAA
ncbi:MAG TPA: hypothetical protein VHO24_12360 [Opitutaceae bacterium]|nr:hypothetical protein [Opitutaceae bacterium]